MKFFDHLLSQDAFTPAIIAGNVPFTPINKAEPHEIVDAQVATTEWLKELGCVDDDEVISKAEAQAAREAFSGAMSLPPAKQKEKLLGLKTPAAVQKHVAMLTEFDWQFVEQAKEIRGYTVSQLLEETHHPDAKVRLKALELLGKVTEVALFTERIEVKKTELKDEELDQRIKEKLAKYGVGDVIDVTPKEEKIVEEDEIPE
jgi:hypothetical protein